MLKASLASPRLREKRKAWYSAYLCLCSLQCKPIRLRGYYDVTYCEFRGFHRIRVPKRSLLRGVGSILQRRRNHGGSGGRCPHKNCPGEEVYSHCPHRISRWHMYSAWHVDCAPMMLNIFLRLCISIGQAPVRAMLALCKEALAMLVLCI